MIKSDFYYDFYFNGKLIRRFHSKKHADDMISWPKLRTYPKKLWEIKKVRKRKLSTGRKATKIKEFEKCQEEK